MKKIIFSILMLTLLVSCKKDTTGAPGMGDEKFDAYKNDFVESMWKIYPEYASGQGYHKYDSVLTIPDAAYRKQVIDFSESNLNQLHRFDPHELSARNVTDYHMIENQLQSQVFVMTELKSYEWDPSQYNVSGPFAEILNGNYAPLKERLQNFSIKMEKIPAYYEAAKKQIKNPTPEH